MNHQQMQRKSPIRRDLPNTLTEIPPEQFPLQPVMPINAWLSKRYLVQLFNEGSQEYPVAYRMSVNRSERTRDNQWRDGITWDELQRIKREIGFGDWYGVEVYPRDADVINDANIRHIWLLQKPLSIGWVK